MRLFFGVHLRFDCSQPFNHHRVGDFGKALHRPALPLGRLVEHVQRSQIKHRSIFVDVRFVERAIHLHESVLRTAVIFGVVSHAIDVVGVVVDCPSRVMLVVIVEPRFGALLWWGSRSGVLTAPSRNQPHDPASLPHLLMRGPLRLSTPHEMSPGHFSTLQPTRKPPKGGFLLSVEMGGVEPPCNG